jgi:hypothetical protein
VVNFAKFREEKLVAYTEMQARIDSLLEEKRMLEEENAGKVGVGAAGACCQRHAAMLSMCVHTYMLLECAVLSPKHHSQSLPGVAQMEALDRCQAERAAEQEVSKHCCSTCSGLLMPCTPLTPTYSPLLPTAPTVCGIVTPTL